jgi:hypothetical protein
MSKISFLSLALSTLLPCLASAQYDITPQPAAGGPAPAEEAVSAEQEGQDFQRVLLMDSQPDISFSGRSEVEIQYGDLGEDSKPEKASIRDTGSDTFVELQKVFQEIQVRNGDTFDVILMEEPGRKWHLGDESGKIYSLTDTKHDGNLTVYTFQATDNGFDRLYFDYIETSDGKPNVVESRILDLTVGIVSAHAK